MYGTLAGMTMTLSNSIAVTQGSCTTPNVTVTLGNHNLSELPAIGSVSSSTPFNIALNSCPASVNSIKYRVDPTTTVLDSSGSVVAFDSSSAASGAGVQLLDSAGKPVPFGTLIGFAGYVPGAGGSYSIPLNARYYRTAATLKPGSANTSMTFTINYQ
jgi:major type 1 subunit fimbrin (pilin)